MELTKLKKMGWNENAFRFHRWHSAWKGQSNHEGKSWRNSSNACKKSKKKNNCVYVINGTEWGHLKECGFCLNFTGVPMMCNSSCRWKLVTADIECKHKKMKKNTHYGMHQNVLHNLNIQWYTCYCYYCCWSL